MSPMTLELFTAGLRDFLLFTHLKIIIFLYNIFLKNAPEKHFEPF